MVALLAAQPVLAEKLDANDLAFAFSDVPALAELGDSAFLSDAEMAETEGKIAPLIYAAALVGGRLILTRVISRRAAVSIVKRGGNVYTINSAQAKNIARQAYGSRNVMRHGPNGHKRSPVHFSHYQASSGYRGSHVMYGRPHTSVGGRW